MILTRFSFLFTLVLLVRQLAFGQENVSGLTISAAFVSKTSLNGTWHFKTDPNNIGEKERWFNNEVAKIHWDSLQVPGNWDVKNEYADYAGKAWLSREFVVQEEWSSKNIRLVFESVYNDAKVWINGIEVGENELGFLPFFFDINQYVKFGESNTIVVLVDNTFKRGAMWNWGGIRRPVYLEVTDKSRLDYQHISALPSLTTGEAEINLSFGLSNFGPKDDKLHVEWEIKQGNKLVWKQKNELQLVKANGNKRVELSKKLVSGDVKLWHFNSPHLYTSVLKLYRGEELIHQLTDRFGIRKVEVDGELVKLNGEVIRTVGFNIVADDRTNGNTLPLWRIMEDVDLMKAAGANMARLSHQPLPKEFLDYLDEKGIMTFEEVALWGKDEMVDPEHRIPKKWLEKMVRYKYNHPSVIGWSVGNEIGFLRMNPKVMEYVEGAIKHAKHLDPSRLAVYVTHSADAQRIDATQFSDMVMLNKYNNWGKSAEKTHRNQPSTPMFYSEFGHKITSEDPNKGVIDIRGMLSEMRNKSYLMGASYWTFNDYRSSYWGTPFSENRSWGVVNVFRQKKRAYTNFRKEYAPVKDIQLLGETEVLLVPRAKMDIPAYAMDGYSLVWEASNHKGEMVDGGFTILPTIRPGDAPIKLKWDSSSVIFSSLKVSLLDPYGYSVYDTTSHLRKPEQPVIVSTHSDSQNIRVVFERHPSAMAWKARYKFNGVVKETVETINDFIDIDSLRMGDTYEVQLIAINNRGESIPSATEVIRTTEDELPPVIWNTEAANNGFYIGYSVDEKDYLYQIQYGNKPGDYDNFHTVQVRTKGVCNISRLDEGKPYYYRMRRLMQWGFASDWTHEIKVIPGERIQPPKVVGVLKSSNEALLIFEPSRKAIGYRVKYTNKTTSKIEFADINASAINYIAIKALAEGNDYSFEIAAVNETDVSAYVAIKALEATDMKLADR